MQALSKMSFAAAAVLLVAIAARADVLASPPVVRASAPRTIAPQTLPDGAGKDVVERLCYDCHDLMFTLTTREDEAGWALIVNDMRSRGTDGTEEEFRQVIAYLTEHMGPAEENEEAVPELIASRTKVAPGERFALGLRLVVAEGWRLKQDGAAGRAPEVTWTMPHGVSIGDRVPPSAGEPAFLVFPAVVAPAAEPGSTLALTARVAYEVCRETCVAETATAAMTLPVGPGGEPSHEAEFRGLGVRMSTDDPRGLTNARDQDEE